MIHTTASQIGFGKYFYSDSHLYLRVKPVNFILNSTLITDVINRGDIFAVRVSTGTLSAMKGNTEVTTVKIESKGTY